MPSGQEESLLSHQNPDHKASILQEQIEGESLSGDKNSAHKFKETFLLSVEEGYSTDDVYNVDETGVN
ncbi:hypothetical protein TNCV_4199861 [Trichonephila clavipes]|uniref:Uncharacterized protein n=1 Tax=Trichonephila clavipes TaxID=2585209 RepID=A0A8X6WBH2_TRICX|nr:hypothetical protein TNCV_4199861 [Trichonephila clavipes]